MAKQDSKLNNIFKNNWEKAHTQFQLPEHVLPKLIAAYFGSKTLIESYVIEGGCANLNIKIHLEHEANPYILRIYLRDKDAAYREKHIADLLKDELPIPHIYYVGDYDDYRFAIVEFVDGMTLRDLLLSESQLSDKDFSLERIMTEAGLLLSKIQEHQFAYSGFFDRNLNIIDRATQNGYSNYALNCLNHPTVKDVLGDQKIQLIRRSILKNMRSIILMRRNVI